MSTDYKVMIGWFLVLEGSLKEERVLVGTTQVCPTNSQHSTGVHSLGKFCSDCGTKTVTKDKFDTVTYDFLDLLDACTNKSDQKFLDQFEPWSSEATGIPTDQQLLFFEGITFDPSEPEGLKRINMKELAKKEPCKGLVKRVKKLTGAKNVTVKFGAVSAVF